MSDTSDLDRHGIWSLDAASSLAALEYIQPDVSPDYSDLMGLDVSGLLDSATYLPPISQDPLLYTSTNTGSTANTASHPSDLPYRANTLGQYPETNPSTPQDRTKGCTSCGLQGTSPDVPVNAYTTGPNHENQLFEASHLRPHVGCNDSFAHATIKRGNDSGMNERTAVFIESKPRKPKFFICKWEGCTHKRNHFRREIDLMRHVKNIHVSPRSYRCDVCNMLFNRRDNLEAHTRRVHVQP
ncbi:hypothetical protein P170DRAFT_435355 [Aspergillus steynii IBT 23096]|uniref:C2H2-type domain-containing protein n=1 Tax=Aspergillus steynii IBT 23096 TaxID=1392250 RepID=A0A2I2GBB2_9EURO|nr:uncharacterized protein P170DRAFT_435355 [Aspergillus steynii IBT 23096]PLB50166.1 hypothetical protein P170DRAFT_435355 [Aspergillus steynii IBT 23096]